MYKEEIKNLEELIRTNESLIKLTEQPGWETLLKSLQKIRVSAFYASIAEGDTTDSKAYARAVDNIIVMLKGAGDETEINDLINRKESLEKNIKEMEDNNSTYNGSSAVI